jgi:hypothetical protein
LFGDPGKGFEVNRLLGSLGLVVVGLAVAPICPALLRC